MSRAALLPSRGDPITLRLVWHYFETVWQDEVDKLYLNVNTPCEKSVVDFIQKFTKHPKVVFSYDDHSLDHGGSLTKMFKQGTEEFIVFIEDDSLIYKKGVLDAHFKYIEAGGFDGVGALRWSCSGPLVDRGREIFGLRDAKYDPGGWFWPCFFFAKRSDLNKTDLNFCGKHWKRGEFIEPMGWYSPEDMDSDTFVWMSIQLRALGLRFMEIPTPCDLGTGWVHLTTLSSPMEYLLTDDNDCPIALRHGKSAYKASPVLAETGEFNKKVAWMKICLEKFDYSEIKEFRDVYEKAIERAIDRFSANRNNIENFRKEYKNALGF